MQTKAIEKRSEYRHYIGWIWKLFGRCWHCGGKNSKPWNDAHLTEFRCGHIGTVCDDCGYITLR